MRLRGVRLPARRSHNAIGEPDQDPTAFGEAFARHTARALAERYSLLPFLYTLFAQAHRSGGTVVRRAFLNTSLITPSSTPPL